MTKVVINTCHSGFDLSYEAIQYMADHGYAEPKEWLEQGWDCGDIARDNPLLVAAVEELGVKANGRLADLKVVEIPNGVAWTIEKYDGLEWVAEQHRTWR